MSRCRSFTLALAVVFDAAQGAAAQSLHIYHIDIDYHIHIDVEQAVARTAAACAGPYSASEPGVEIVTGD